MRGLRSEIVLALFSTFSVFSCTVAYVLKKPLSEDVCEQCIYRNSACLEQDSSRVLKTFPNIQNQRGCAEKCSEIGDCNYWTWYDRASNHSFDCVLFNSCPDEDHSCKYCYTGERECYSSTYTKGTLFLGGTSLTTNLVTSVEILIDGLNPFIGSMQDIPSQFLSGNIAGALVGNQNIYVCGVKEDSFSVCFNYNLPIFPANSWPNQTTPPMNTSRKFATAVSAYGELFVIGGFDANSKTGAFASPTIEAFNPSTNSWRTILWHATSSAEPRQRAAHCALRKLDAIYLIGGESKDARILSIDVFNLTSNIWKTFEATDLGIPNLESPSCSFISDHEIWISGGKTDNRADSRVWSWNYSTNFWHILPSLNIPRYSHVMSPYNGTVIAAGGFNSEGLPMRSIEILQGDTWVLGQENFSLISERGQFIKVDVPQACIYHPPK